ncbi:MAG: hypothetical protein J6Q68_04765 [Clostridia bacterium]|nr:hypothetical protein [Clostridia bacterium]
MGNFFVLHHDDVFYTSSLGENGKLRQNMPLLMVATAAEYNYYCKDNDPSTVIIEDVAQAVVIHYVFPPEVYCGVFSCRLIPYYAEG